MALSHDMTRHSACLFEPAKEYLDYYLSLLFFFGSQELLLENRPSHLHDHNFLVNI